MSTLLETGIVRAGQYYTDGNRLYRIVEVAPDETVLVENCETLFTHEIALETVLYWIEVEFDVFL